MKIAALVTTYHVRAHADNFVTGSRGLLDQRAVHGAPCDIVSLYMDQIHPADIGRRLASAYGFPVVKSIRKR